MTASTRVQRVAFVADAPPRAWMARAVERAAAVCEETHVVLLPGPPDAMSWFDRYAALDRKLLGGAAADPLAAVEIAALAPAVVTQLDRRENLTTAVSRLEVDVVVDLTPTECVEPDSVDASVWVIRHDGEAAAATAAGYDGFASGAATSVTELVERTADSECVVYRTHSLIRRVSLQRTRSPLYWKAAALPARALTQPRRDLGTASQRTAGRQAGLGELTLLAARTIGRLLRLARTHATARPSWSIVWRRSAERSTGAFVPTGRLDPPVDSFYADPFVLSAEGRHYVFYEAFRRALGRAELVVQELGASADAARTILARPYHLSYPFVFHADNGHYLIPESAEHSCVQLFRATRFPWTWQLDATLLEFAAYDPTLLEHDGRYFLFVAIAEPGADIDELHVYWSGNLRGPYLPHALNPVVSDVTRSRPAGRVYRDGDRLMRPSQDGSGGYGSAVVRNEIVHLTPSSYEERPIDRLTADWDAAAVGMHTIDHDGEIEVADVKTLQPRRLRRTHS